MSVSDDYEKDKSTRWGLRAALIMTLLFFANIVMQKFWPGTLEVTPAEEAVLLVLTIACFITGCLQSERIQVASRQDSQRH